MSDLKEAADQFLQGVEQASSLWKALDVRVMAFLVGDRWCNALTNCRLAPAPPEDVPRVRYLVETPHVRTIQRVLPLADLPRPLEAFGSRIVSYGDWEVHYPGERPHEVPRSYGGDTHFREVGVRRSWGPEGWIPAPAELWPTWSFEAGGQTFDDLQRTGGGERGLDDEIHALRSPLDGVLGAAEHVVGLRLPQRGTRRCEIRVVAPFPARFEAEACTLQQGSLQVTVAVGTDAAAEALEVGVVVEGGGEVLLADTRTVDPSAWVEDGGRRRGTVTLHVPGAEAATVLLRLHGRRIERIRVEDYSHSGVNPRLVAWAAADDDFAVFLAGFRPTERGEAAARSFERAVSRLFTFLGFQVLSFGPEGLLNDAADVVALSPYGRSALVLECTLGPIDNGGKLGKLHRRAAQLAELLPAYEVQPVLVTSLERKLLADRDVEAAAKDRIAVVTGDDCDELFGLARSGVPVERVREYCVARIPRRSDAPSLSSLMRPGR